MRLTFLGTGTSTGVPAIGCRCPVCLSNDSRDKRLRSSVLLEFENNVNLIIDCGPDFREQMLRMNSPSLTAALITHTHFDHLGGVDDLRPYSHNASDGHFPIYCRADVAEDLRNRVPYCFVEDPYPGVPTFNIHEIEERQKFFIPGLDRCIETFLVKHGKLPILGYRIGDFAYITDCSSLPEESKKALRGLKVLVVNSLRQKPHPSHMSLSETLALIEELKPEKTWLTHLSHDMGFYREVEPMLPSGVHLATDFLQLEIP